MDPNYIVLKQLGCEDPTPYVIAHHNKPGDAGGNQRLLIVDGWYETEDAARADAHRLLFGVD